MNRQRLRIAIGIIAALFGVLLILYSAPAAEGAKSALLLCANVLIPSLLPFFICSFTVINSGLAPVLGKGAENITHRLFNINGSGAVAVICGFLSGYPTGAAVTARLYADGCISRNEAERLVSFTNNSGPLFILGAVGTGIYKSAAAGAILLISHFAAAVTLGIILGFFGKASATGRGAKRSGAPIMSAFSDGVHTILTLCGFVIFFGVVLSVLSASGIMGLIQSIIPADPATARLLAGGLIEISTAVSSSGCTFLPAVSCVLSWGGASVIMQTASILSRHGLSVKKYILARILCGGISALYTSVLLKFITVTLPAFAL